MGNALFYSLAPEGDKPRRSLCYRFSRCCICMGSLPNLKVYEIPSKEDEERKDIIKCKNEECSRIFHDKCLGEHFESVGTKTCPGCRQDIEDKVDMVTEKSQESSPSR